MQRAKNVQIKEVIATLCKLLSALDVESVPPAESFRRAKFNKTDAVRDLWQLLWSLLRKAFEPDCACANPADPDGPWVFVRSALWHSGYGAGWVVGPQAWPGTEGVGSRELLLAAGWLLASGNLLEGLLREKVLQLDLLSSSLQGPPGVIKEDRVAGRDLKGVQWRFGSLRLRWRSVLEAQRECSRLSHEVSSRACPASASETVATGDPGSTGSTALGEDLERVRTLNRVLEAYLEWKGLEPLFWCWMDSVVDGCVPGGCSEGPVVVPPVVSRTCSHGAQAGTPEGRLDEISVLLRNRLQLGRGPQTARLQAVQDGLGPGRRAGAELRVESRLRGLSPGPPAVARGVIPCLRRPRPPGPAGGGGGSGGPGHLGARPCLSELRLRGSVLERELELLRRSQRERMHARGGGAGLLLIPPLKR